MNKFFIGLLAVAALALFVTQAVAEKDDGGVVVIETYSAEEEVATPKDNHHKMEKEAHKDTKEQPVEIVEEEIQETDE